MHQTTQFVNKQMLSGLVRRIKTHRKPKDSRNVRQLDYFFKKGGSRKENEVAKGECS